MEEQAIYKPGNSNVEDSGDEEDEIVEVEGYYELDDIPEVTNAGPTPKKRAVSKERAKVLTDLTNLPPKRRIARPKIGDKNPFDEPAQRGRILYYINYLYLHLSRRGQIT